MTQLTVFPEHLESMTEADLAALPAEQLREVHFNLERLVDWVKKTQLKTHNAMQRRYAEQERAARAKTGKDFGSVHFRDGPLRVTVDTPKRVSWDQKQLAEIAHRIASSGERLEEYLDVEFSVPESRFTNWPSALQEQFALARTVKPGKRVYGLVRNDDCEVI